MSSYEQPCAICNGLGTYPARYPVDGEPVDVDCWCTDDYEVEMDREDRYRLVLHNLRNTIDQVLNDY